VWLLWLWPFVTYLLMGVAYFLTDPADTTTHRPMGVVLLGKELDGSMRWYCVLFMLPVLVPLWTFWYLRHSTLLRNERPYDEIVPGVYLGRFPVMTLFSKWTREQTFPADSTTIVDLVAEMPVPRSVYRGRRYFSIPTLDQCPPNIEALREVGTTLGSFEESSGNLNSARTFRRLYTNEDTQGEGVRVRGAVCVICANGRGRSAAFVMTLLVMRGDCETVEQAIELIRKARPQINPKDEQIRAAKEAVSQWRAYETSKKSRSRNLSNTPAVSDQFAMDVTLDSTESTNVIPMFAPGLSTAKLQVESSFSKKRGQGELEPPLFCFSQSADDAAPTLEVAREDIYLVVSEAFKHLQRQVGGDLFGRQEDDTAKPVRISHVTGPGPKAVVAPRIFRQDEDYFRQALGVLSASGLRRVGEW
jgi:protein-tyrosine phosphatase